jgi:hypothetical protein
MKVCGKDIKIQGRLARIACLDGDKYTFPENPEELLANLRRCGTRIDIFTFLQKLPDTSPRYPYPFETDNLAVLPISTFENWWHKQIKSYPRNRARQAEKHGVVMREVHYGEALVQGICQIYNETPIRQGRKFPHFGMTLVRARQYAGTFLDRSVYIGAFLGDQMIGFIKLTMDEGGTQASLVHILSMAKHKDKAPTNALIAEAVKACAERNISYLVYENFTYGSKIGDGLSRFKEVNGFQRVNTPRYYVPLTSIGSIALCLGLHHRLSERIPESIAARYRELRRLWYERRFSTSMVAEQ